jgi:hypothetical protein
MGRNLPPLEIIAALRSLGLLGARETATGEALTGGVSSDIWRIDLPSGPICAKRALSRLKVAAVWEAPVVRNQYEAGWMRRAEAAVPGVTPGLLGQIDGVLAMRFLPPDHYHLWKSALRDGHADPEFAGQVAASLVRIHTATPDAAAEFPTDDIFRAIRLEPYLLATGAVHPDLAGVLQALVATTEAAKMVLVHGDVSPKNILIGPDGPVFLDAECAWFGDPAFDVAFCLNHLLLKCLWNPSATAGFLACFDRFVARYFAGVTWEAAGALEARAAHLLPGLLLARVDGKSPVEYITQDADRTKVRSVARALLLAPVDRLVSVRAAWAREISA